MVGCFKTELTAEEKQLVADLKAQLATVDEDIKQARTKDELLAGGLVKALIGARLEVLKTNQALIQQRIHSVESGSPVKQVTELVKADPDLATKLEAELMEAKIDLAVSEKDAQNHGGLVGAMKAARAATEGQTVAMLQQRFLTAKYGLSAPVLSESPATQSEPSTEQAGGNGGIDKAELALCAEISENSARHRCYDDLSTRHGIASERVATTAPAPDVGTWMVSTRTDPLTDDEIHTAMLIAASGRSRFRDVPTLTVRCSGARTELYINWNDYLGSDAYTTYRVGQDKAATSNWSLSTDKKAAFFPGSPVALLKRMADSDSFAASVTPYNESPVTALFDTTGAAAAFSDIRKACSW